MPEKNSFRVLRRAEDSDARPLAAYRSLGGYAALEKAIRQQTPEQIIQQVVDSRLRGLGGAGRLAGEKWRLVRKANDEQKYVICNAYDADSRSYVARTLLALNPHQVIEGIVLAAYAVGASEAYLFTRSLYTEGIAAVQTALGEALDANLVGRFPAQYGLWDKPTSINNVETLANVPLIINEGAAAFAGSGTVITGGCKILTVHDFAVDAEPTLVEVPFGTTLRDILTQAGVRRADDELRAIVVGGAEGGALPASLLDTPYDFDAIENVGAIVGPGVIEVLPVATCMVAWAMERSRYLGKESCGKCVPCRLGVKRIEGILEGIVSDLGVSGDLDVLDEFADYVPNGSLCGFGVQATNPLKTAKRYWPEHFTTHIQEQQCPTKTCLPVRAHRFVTKHVLP